MAKRQEVSNHNHLRKEKGGDSTKILRFQKQQLHELETLEPLSEETGCLLNLVLEFLTEAQDLDSKPLHRRTEAEQKLRQLRNKMSLLNKVSATGREILLEGTLN